MASNQNTALLEINNLTVRFYTNIGVIKAVNGISYQLSEGDLMGIVGESGCGKTVHARAIMRLIPIPPGAIEGGEIWYDGQDLLKLDSNEMHRIRGSEIAMIFQEPNSFLNPVFTIGYQIVEAIKLHQKIKRKEAYEKAAELLTLAGIPEASKRLKDYPHQFSGGMRQRAMIAMSLSCNPRVLIADEPTTALDVTIQAEIIDLVKKLQEQLGMAVIWITHDLGVAAGLIKKINVMYAGYIVENGTAKDVFKKPRHPYTRGLLASIPRINQAQGSKLFSIPGSPPDPILLQEGCPFFPRCFYASDQCHVSNPILEPTDDRGQNVACWNWRLVTHKPIA